MRIIGLPELVALFGMLFLFGFALLLLGAAHRRKQARSVQLALINRLSGSELAGLLQTPQGEKLLQRLAEGGVTPGHTILMSVQRGIVVILAGVGIFVAAALTHPPAPVPAIGVILIFLGIGLLAAAFVAYRLSKRWRLLEGNGERSPGRQAD